MPVTPVRPRRTRSPVALLARLGALRRPPPDRRPRRFAIGLLAATMAAAGLLVVTGPPAAAAPAATTVAATDGRIFRLPGDGCYRDYGTFRPSDFPASWPTGTKVFEMTNYAAPERGFVWDKNFNFCDPPAGYAWDYGGSCTLGGFACIPLRLATFSNGATYSIARQVLVSSIPVPAPTTPPSPCGAPTIPNASFESGSTGWTPYGTVSVGAAGAQSGAAGVQVTNAGGMEQTIRCLNPDTTYTLTAQAKVASTGSMCVGAKQYNPAGTDTSQCGNATGWALRQVHFTTGPTNTSARVFFYRPGAGTGYGDAISLRTAAPLPPVTNGSFETSTSGWTPSGSAVTTTSTAAAGTASIQLTGASAAEQTISGLSANTSYTLTGTAKVGATGRVCVGVKLYNAAGTDTNRCINNTAWASAGVTFLTGPSNTSARVYFRRADAGTAYGDDLVLQRSVPGTDCGAPGYLTWPVVASLANAGYLTRTDPCALTGKPDAFRILVAGPPYGILRTASGEVWEVWDNQQVMEPLAGNRTSTCLKLRGTMPVTNAANAQLGVVTINQRICQSWDFLALRPVLSDGTYDTAARRWRPPPPPTISVASNQTLIGMTNGGPGNSGLISTALVPYNGQLYGAWEVQVQAIVHVGLGVPKSDGFYVGWQKSVQKEYTLTVLDIPDQ